MAQEAHPAQVWRLFPARIPSPIYSHCYCDRCTNMCDLLDKQVTRSCKLREQKRRDIIWDLLFCCKAVPPAMYRHLI